MILGFMVSVARPACVAYDLLPSGFDVSTEAHPTLTVGLHP